MLLNTIVSTSTTSIISSGAAEIAMMSIPVDIPEFEVLPFIALILLLSLKEILSVSTKWSKSVAFSLNMAIMPLLLIFAAIIITKISEMI